MVTIDRLPIPQQYWLNKRRQRAANEGVGFSLDAYLASLTAAAYYDSTKLDRLFQENTGITLADDVGESVGLWLDQATWGGKTLAQLIAAQPEKWSNPTPTISNVSGTVGAYNSGTRTMTNTGATVSGYPRFFFDLGLAVGKTYFVTGRLDGDRAKAGMVRLADSGSANNIAVPNASTGLFSGYATAAAAVGGKVGIEFLTFLTSADTGLTIAQLSVKEVPGFHGVQATGSLKGTRQSAGVKYDGSDDNHLTTYLAASGKNFIQVKATIPATVSALQVLAGASGSGANRVYLGIDTSGRACAGVGSDTTSTIVGTSDLRNTEATIALTFDGTTVRLIVNGVIEYEAAQNSTPTTTIPLRIGGLNNNGSAGSYTGAAIKKLICGTDYLDLSRFNQISNTF